MVIGLSGVQFGDIYVLRKWTKSINGDLDGKLKGKYLTAGEWHHRQY